MLYHVFKDVNSQQNSFMCVSAFFSLCVRVCVCVCARVRFCVCSI